MDQIASCYPQLTRQVNITKENYTSHTCLEAEIPRRLQLLSLKTTNPNENKKLNEENNLVLVAYFEEKKKSVTHGTLHITQNQPNAK